VCFLVVDLPLTAVGDTLTLPIAISYTLQCRALSRKQGSESATSASDLSASADSQIGGGRP
jgi:hypothetical protein